MASPAATCRSPSTGAFTPHRRRQCHRLAWFADMTGLRKSCSQGFEEADTAEAGSDHQHPVGFRRALRTHLAIEMLDILLECHALGIQVAWRGVPPFAAGVNAHMPGG